MSDLYLCLCVWLHNNKESMYVIHTYRIVRLSVLHSLWPFFYPLRDVQYHDYVISHAPNTRILMHACACTLRVCRTGNVWHLFTRLLHSSQPTRVRLLCFSSNGRLNFAHHQTRKKKYI